MVEIDGVKYEYPVNYEWPKDMLRVRDEMMKKFKIGEFVKNAIKEATMIDYEKKYKEAKEIVAFIKGWQCGISSIPEEDRTDRQSSVLETLITIEAYATLTDEERLIAGTTI